MDSSTPRLTLLLLSAVAANADAQETPAAESCTVEFASTTLDAQSSRAVFRGVRINCEDASIAADEAAASEPVPEKGRWQLRGNIRITVASAVFSAESATFTFAQKALVSGELVGNPVTLEDIVAENNRSVRATAPRITYDNINRTARTEGGASLALGTSEMSGCGDIIYDLDRGLVDSVSTCDEPFVIKYVSPQTNDPTTAESAPAP